MILWYVLYCRATKAQTSLRLSADSSDPSLLHTQSMDSDGDSDLYSSAASDLVQYCLPIPHWIGVYGLKY